MKNKPLRLTEKQERFCRHYLDTDGNASEAYRMAYDTAKMQPSTVHYSAWELMNNPKVTQRIDELRAERREATEEQRKEIEARLIDIINADPFRTLLHRPRHRAGENPPTVAALQEDAPRRQGYQGKG